MRGNNSCPCTSQHKRLSARGKPLGSGEADSPQVGPVAALAVHREPQKSGQHALSPSFSQEVFRELCKN